MNLAQWAAGHMLVDPEGKEVLPDTEVTWFRDGETCTFHKLTRAPGDGTGTNGKMLATVSKGARNWKAEYYPPTGYRIVPRPGFDPTA